MLYILPKTSVCSKQYGDVDEIRCSNLLPCQRIDLLIYLFLSPKIFSQHHLTFQTSSFPSQTFSSSLSKKKKTIYWVNTVSVISLSQNLRHENSTGLQKCLTLPIYTKTILSGQHTELPSVVVTSQRDILTMFKKVHIWLFGVIT